MAKNNKRKDHHSRIGDDFFQKIENIKDKRLINGNSKDRTSTEKISNLIVKHKFWKQIEEDIINADEEEIEKHNAK